MPLPEDPLKPAMKALYQNFSNIGERSMDIDTTKREVNMADSVIFLKYMKSRPNPRIEKRQVSTNMLTNMGWLVKLTGSVFAVILRYSPAKPKIHSSAKMTVMRMMPMFLFA
mgnify:CR=1 FL=1